MRTNIVLDDNLVKEGLALGNFKTKNDLVNDALKFYVDSMKKKFIQDLKGEIQFHDDWDYKKMRGNRF